MALYTWLGSTSGNWGGNNWSTGGGGGTVPPDGSSDTIGVGTSPTAWTVTLRNTDGTAGVVKPANVILAASSNVTLQINSGAELRTTASVTINTSDTIAGAGIVTVGTTTSGTISGAGTLLATGGTLTLNARNQFTGGAGVQVTLAAAASSKLSVTAGLQTGTANVIGKITALASTEEIDLLGTGQVYTVASGFSITGGSLVVGGTSKIVDSSGGAMSSGSLVDNTTNATGLAGLTLSSLTGGKIIIGDTNASLAIVGSTLVVTDAVASTSETITVTGGLAGATISGGTLTAACYLEGTQIRTATGEVRVEDLAIGDLIITATAGPQAVRWIGQRAYLARLVNQHHRADLMPVRIAAGALSDNLPTRDLFVSPEHMMALDGVLVAARNLINGSTITSFDDLDVVKYFHIELDQHAVIFAEGAPAESYLDTGNRNMFTNVLDYAERGMPVGAVTPCLPIVSGGPTLTAIRARIADRATACGFTMSADADLHLLVDGAPVYPSVINGQSFSFDIAQSASDVRIVCRSAVPSQINPISADGRRLGVAVSGLTLQGSGMSIEVLASDKSLTDGFYPADGGHRWTNGSASVPTALLALMDGTFSITVQLVGTDLQYPVADQGSIVALASARTPRASADQRRVA